MLPSKLSLFTHTSVFLFTLKHRSSKLEILTIFMTVGEFLSVRVRNQKKNPSLQIAPINHRRRKEMKSGTAKAEMDIGWVHPWLGLGWVE